MMRSALFVLVVAIVLCGSRGLVSSLLRVNSLKHAPMSQQNKQIGFGYLTRSFSSAKFAESTSKESGMPVVIYPLDEDDHVEIWNEVDSRRNATMDTSSPTTNNLSTSLLSAAVDPSTHDDTHVNSSVDIESLHNNYNYNKTNKSNGAKKNYALSYLTPGGIKLPQTSKYLSTSSVNISAAMTQGQYVVLNERMNKLEKMIAASIVNPNSKKGSIGSFVDSITTRTFDVNAKSVEVCSMISFIFIGMFFGWSLYDRFWLLGSIAGGWWSSVVVHKDTNSGLFVRRVGVYFASIMKELQALMNYTIIYYRTGKLALEGKSKWDKVDKTLNIEIRIKKWKKLVAERAMYLNAETNILDQASDLWKAIKVEVPKNARRIDNEYAIVANTAAFTKGLFVITRASTTNVFRSIIDIGKGGNGKSLSKKSSRKVKNTYTWFGTPVKEKTFAEKIQAQFGLKKQKKTYNPWTPPSF